MIKILTRDCEPRVNFRGHIANDRSRQRRQPLERAGLLLVALLSSLAAVVIWTNSVSANVDFVTKWGATGSGNGQFNGSFGVAVDSTGNVYVSDSGNNRIQKFNSSGTYVTQFGTAGPGNGQFLSPIGVAVDSFGNVLVADVSNNRIEQFSAAGSYITKWGSAGSGDGQFNHPYGVAVDVSGNSYVADSSNHRIQKFDSSGTFITKWGTHGGGNGQFDNPRGLAVDLSGNVYVADVGNTRIQKFDANGTYLTQWGVEGTNKGQFEFVAGVTVDAWGYVYVTDASSHNIQKFTPTGSFVTRWGTSGSGDGQLTTPFGLATDTLGNVYVADSGNNRIQKFGGAAPEEYFTLKWGQPGSSPGTFLSPLGVAVDSAGNVYVVDSNNNRIQKFTATGTFITQWGSMGSGDGQFTNPWGIALDSGNNVYVTEIFNARVQKFTSSGAFITKWNTGGTFSRGIAVDRLGNVYVSDEGNNCIRKFGPSGNLITQWGSTGSGNGQFMAPRAIAVDFAGHVYAADIGNARIQKFDSSGNFITKWGSLGSGPGQMFNMNGIGVDAAGNVYVGDTGNSPTNNNNNRIEKFTPSGTFVIQWGSHGSANGQFQVPFQVAVDASGNVYVADVDNVRIQKFSQGAPVSSAGPDQTFTCVLTPTQTVTLNGSGTTDPTAGDAATLDYEWSEGTTLLGTGASLTLPFTAGVHTITLAVTDDSNYSTTDTIVIGVSAYDHATCNTAPVAVDDPSTINEDSAANVISVRSNDTDFDNDTLTVTAVTQGTHGSVAINGGGTGLTYTPAADYNGSDTFTYTINDGHGGSSTANVSATVAAVNDAPSFTKGANQTVNVGAGAQTVSNWATNIMAGPADEAGQTLNFIVANDNNSLFSVQPAIAANGTLTYTPAANATGSATVFVLLQDNGGTDHNGVDMSVPQSFRLSISSPTAAPASISGRIITNEGSPLGGVVVTLNGPTPARAITNSDGFYEFAEQQTDNFYTLIPQIANYSFTPQSRSFSLLGDKTDAVFTANPDATPTGNPLDTAEFFVRQQYLDMLGREPDQSGLIYWSDQILACGNDVECLNTRRRDVAASFFIEPEGQQTGSYICDLYASALGRRPSYDEYRLDRQQVIGGAELEFEKAAFAQGFTHRAEFTARYQSNTTAESFVDALIQSVRQGPGADGYNPGIDFSGERDVLINAYNSGGNMDQSRSLVLRMVADNTTFKQSQYNAAFVLTEYFAYLQRDADPNGYNFWLNILNSGNGDNYRGMVCSFVTSIEYQKRFGPIVTRSNGDCGP